MGYFLAAMDNLLGLLMLWLVVGTVVALVVEKMAHKGGES